MFLSSSPPATLCTHSGIATVDVRDVAAAHTLGLFTPSAKGRYVCSAQTVKLADMANVIADFYPTRYELLQVWGEGWVDADRHVVQLDPGHAGESCRSGSTPPLLNSHESRYGSGSSLSAL